MKKEEKGKKNQNTTVDAVAPAQLTAEGQLTIVPWELNFHWESIKPCTTVCLAGCPGLKVPDRPTNGSALRFEPPIQGSRAKLFFSSVFFFLPFFSLNIIIIITV